MISHITESQDEMVDRKLTISPMIQVPAVPALVVFGWLQKRGLKRRLALFLLILILLGGGIGLLLLALTSVAALESGLETCGDQLSARRPELSAALAGPGMDITGISEQIAAFSSTVLVGLLAGMAGALSDGLVSIVIVAFFLLESDRFLNIARSGVIKDRPMLSQLPVVGQTAVTYFSIRARLNLITGTGVTLICLLLGVDYPLLWGVLAFFLSFIPYIGLATAMIPPALLALAEFGWLQAAIVVIGITVINLLIENVLKLGYTGKRLSLSPTVVFISFFFRAWLLGPIGAFAFHAYHGHVTAHVSKQRRHSLAGQNHRPGIHGFLPGKRPKYEPIVR